MTDLFATIPTPPDRTIGKSNGQFLGHLANGKSRAELLAMHQRGELPGLNTDIAKDNLKFKNRS